MSFGLKVLKFFPAEQNGGISAIKAICGPYNAASALCPRAG